MANSKNLRPQRNVKSFSGLIRGKLFSVLSFSVLKLVSLCGTGNEVQKSTKQKLDLIYGVDFEGSSLLHLAIDSGVLKVTC